MIDSLANKTLNENTSMNFNKIIINNDGSECWGDIGMLLRVDIYHWILSAYSW